MASGFSTRRLAGVVANVLRNSNKPFSRKVHHKVPAGPTGKKSVWGPSSHETLMWSNRFFHSMETTTLAAVLIIQFLDSSKIIGFFNRPVMKIEHILGKKIFPVLSVLFPSGFVVFYCKCDTLHVHSFFLLVGLDFCFLWFFETLTSIFRKSHNELKMLILWESGLQAFFVANESFFFRKKIKCFTSRYCCESLYHMSSQVLEFSMNFFVQDSYFYCLSIDFVFYNFTTLSGSLGSTKHHRKS